MTAPASAAAPVVELRRARLGYGRRAVLEEVDLVVHPGDFLAVVGPNGAGKSTLLRTVLGVLPPLGGACRARGRPGYAPQRSTLDPVFPFSAAEVVAMGLVGPWGLRVGRTEAASRVERALVACGMESHARARYRDLSGGQKQRLLVARALVADPDALVLDEPTNDLDLRGEHELMELIRDLHAAGTTVIMVSHMLHVVARYARRIAFIAGGRLHEGTAAEMLTAARLGELYGMTVAVGEFEGHRGIAPAGAPRPGPEGA